MNARPRGFTLVEVAVACVIVALLVSSLMYTLSAQSDQRAIEETRRRLEQARELLLNYAVVNRRLPCPARCSSWPACDSGTYATSDEVREVATGKCTGGGTDDYYGGTLAVGPPQVIGGLLPAATIGYPQTDSRGYAVDTWGNRIRYAVAKARATGTCGTTPPAGTIIWTNNLQTYGMACQPDDLLICKTSQVTPAISSTSCGGSSPPANQIMSQSLVVAIVFSTGKNGAIYSAGAGADEQANVSDTTSNDPVFVYHAPQPTGASGGEFDDQFTWITVGELMGKLVAAGRLP